MPTTDVGTAYIQLSAAPVAAPPPPSDALSLLTIDLGAITANWRLLQARSGVETAAVVKADGYGVGAIPVARALLKAGCRQFFVATAEEGVALRAALPQAGIAILSGVLSGEEATYAAHDLIPILSDATGVEAWLSFAGRTGIAQPAMLHVDTGMNRLGLPPRDFLALAARPEVAAYPWRCLISHLACADEPDHPLNERQRAAFAALRARLPDIPASLAASSGIFLGPPYQHELVRPGAALFGVNPHPGRPNPLSATVSLTARILQVRDIDRDMTVGYGAAHMAGQASKIATIAVGYADGYLRAAGSRGTMYLGGHAVPVVGRISMDLVTIEVTHVPPSLAHPGAWVELIGPHCTVDDVAADCGTIGYEILTSLGSRHHRRYLETAA